MSRVIKTSGKKIKWKKVKLAIVKNKFGEKNMRNFSKKYGNGNGRNTWWNNYCKKWGFVQY